MDSSDQKLYIHQPHPHQPRNVAAARRDDRPASFNERLAVRLTAATGTMPTAYIFAGIGIGSLVGVFTGNVFLASACGSISSYFLQLVALPVLQVGMNVLSRHAEAQAEETFHDVERTLHDIEQVARHLDAQDDAFLRRFDAVSSDVTDLRELIAELRDLNRQQNELLTQLKKETTNGG